MSELRSRMLQNVLALTAAAFVVGALLPWPLRVACIFAAVGVLLLIAVLRFQDHSRLASSRRTGDTFGRIERLRADRAARYKKPGRRI